MGWPGPVTLRQMSAWSAWLELELNRPNRSDFYAMQTALEVRRLFRDKPEKFKLNDMKLTLGYKQPEVVRTEATPEARAHATALSKAVWGQRLGRKIK